MKIDYLPGTNLPVGDYEPQAAEKALRNVFAVTGGVFLSQLSELTQVPAAALQNWVKRGYVSSPIDRKYSMRQTTRMILIALLRKTLPMETLVDVLSSLNHNLADESDDIIDDSQLYLYFCEIFMRLSAEQIFDPDRLHVEISARTADLGFEPEQKACLDMVLSVLVQSYASVLLQNQVHKEIQIMKEGEFG